MQGIVGSNNSIGKVWLNKRSGVQSSLIPKIDWCKKHNCQK